MPPAFNPKDWYWFVAGDQTRVYSSKFGDYVPVSDLTYQAWLAQPGHVTQSIASEADLGGVLDPYSLRPVAAGVLDGYLESQSTRLTLEVVAKVLFNHENRIRSLAGQPQINATQFKAAIKALL